MSTTTVLIWNLVHSILVLVRSIQLTSVKPASIQRKTVQCYNYSNIQVFLIYYCCDNTRKVSDSQKSKLDTF
jgi:hypothetical protein